MYKSGGGNYFTLSSAALNDISIQDSSLPFKTA